MIVIQKRIGEPYQTTIIADSDRSLTHEVGDMYELIPLYGPYVLVRAENAHLQPGNAMVMTMLGPTPIHGDFIVCRERIIYGSPHGGLQSIDPSKADEIIDRIKMVDLPEKKNRPT